MGLGGRYTCQVVVCPAPFRGMSILRVPGPPVPNPPLIFGPVTLLFIVFLLLWPMQSTNHLSFNLLS